MTVIGVRASPLKASATQGDVGGLDEGRDAVAYLKPHVLHRACGNNGGNLADAGLHDDLTQYLVRDNLLHGAGYFVGIDCSIKSHPSSSAIDCATVTYLWSWIRGPILRSSAPSLLI